MLNDVTVLIILSLKCFILRRKIPIAEVYTFKKQLWNKNLELHLKILQCTEENKSCGTYKGQFEQPKQLNSPFPIQHYPTNEKVELTHFRSLLRINVLHIYFGGNQAHTLKKNTIYWIRAMSFKSFDNSFTITFENRKLNFSTSDLNLHKLYINKKIQNSIFMQSKQIV